MEKLPLCYIRGFEYASTETRKIVKEEERIVHFLDFREKMYETDFHHEQTEECQSCDLRSICSGIYEKAQFFPDTNVYPQKLEPGELEAIKNKIIL